MFGRFLNKLLKRIMKNSKIKIIYTKIKGMN